MEREKWYVQNISNKSVSIGDLPKVPAIQPGKALDLLNFYDKDKIGKSINLIDLSNMGLISIIKTVGASFNKTQIYEKDEVDTITNNLQTQISSIESAVNGLEIQSGVSFPVNNTSDLTINLVSGSRIVQVIDCSNGDVTVNLPASSGNEGLYYYIKKIDSTGNTITINPNGSETIDGDLTKIISNRYTSLQIVCNGSNWYII